MKRGGRLTRKQFDTDCGWAKHPRKAIKRGTSKKARRHSKTELRKYLG